MENEFLTALGLVRKAGKLVIGWDRIEQYKGKIFMLITSCDAAERTKKNARSRGNVLETDFDMETLGRAVGIGKAAVAAVTDEGFSVLLNKKSSEKQ